MIVDENILFVEDFCVGDQIKSQQFVDFVIQNNGD